MSESFDLEAPDHFTAGAIGPAGVVPALRLSNLISGNLGNGIEIVAALLIVAAAALSIGSTVANWRMNVPDQFAAKPLGYYLAAINATLVSIGLLIFIVGVFKGL